MITLNLAVDEFPYTEQNIRLLVRIRSSFVSAEDMEYYARRWFAHEYEDKRRFEIDAKDMAEHILRETKGKNCGL